MKINWLGFEIGGCRSITAAVCTVTSGTSLRKDIAGLSPSIVGDPDVGPSCTERRNLTIAGNCQTEAELQGNTASQQADRRPTSRCRLD